MTATQIRDYPIKKIYKLNNKIRVYVLRFRFYKPSKTVCLACNNSTLGKTAFAQCYIYNIGAHRVFIYCYNNK